MKPFRRTILLAVMLAIFLLLPSMVDPLVFAGRSPDGGAVIDSNPSARDGSDITGTTATGGDQSGGGRGIRAECALEVPQSYFAGCITFLIIPAGGAVLGFAGQVFNFFFSLTLNRDFYDALYISNTWAVFRDIANLGFIIGIIAVAFALILGGMDGNFNGRLYTWKKALVKLIVAALLINFTMFGSRVLVDIGNLVALVFVNQIQFADGTKSFTDEYGSIVGKNGGSLIGNGTEGGSGDGEGRAYPISDAFVENLRIDTLLGPEIINNLGTGTRKGSNHGFWFLFNIIFVVITFGMAFSLFFTSFYFLARTINIIVLMIISPLAAVAFFLPATSPYAKRWLLTLVSNCFCVSAYVFFLYLLVILTKGLGGANYFGGKGVANDAVTAIGVLFSAGLPVLILVSLTVFLLLQANKQTQKLCQIAQGSILDIGGFMKQKLPGAVGKVGGVATGVGGVAARGVIGGIGYKMSKGEYGVGRLARSNNGFLNAVGQAGLYVGDNLRDSKFGLKRSYVDQRKVASKRVENSANRLANLETDVLIPELESKAKSRLVNTFVQDGMDQASAEKLADTLKKDEAKKEAQKISRERALTRVKTRSTPIDFVLAGGITGAKDEAVRSLEGLDEQDTQKVLKDAQRRNEQRVLAAETATIQTAVENKVTRTIDEYRQRPQGSPEEENQYKEELRKNVLGTIQPAYTNKISPDGGTTFEETYIPGGKLATMHKREADRIVNALSEARQQQLQLHEQDSDTKEVKNIAATIKGVLDRVRKKEETQLPYSPVSVTEKEKQVLLDQNITLNANGEITSDASADSLEAVFNTLSEELKASQSSEKKVEKEKEKVEKSFDSIKKGIVKPVADQMKSRRDTGAALSTAKQLDSLDEIDDTEKALQDDNTLAEDRLNRDTDASGPYSG